MSLFVPAEGENAEMRYKHQHHFTSTLTLRDTLYLAGSALTLELVLVLICTLVLSDQDLGGHVQTDNTRVRHQEEHDKLLAHHPQRLVLPTVNRGWTRRTEKLSFSTLVKIFNSEG